jgi:S-adenosylmethionine:tRNA ribosyltransferase-isomerase
MRVSDFDYELPEELIAQRAVEPRDSALLMVLNRAECSIEHKRFHNLPQYLRQGDVLVLNDTRVMAWRVVGKWTTGGKVEGLLLGRDEAGNWRAMLKGHGRLRRGKKAQLFDGQLEAELVEREDEGVWRLKLLTPGAEELIEKLGRAPLPPYIRRKNEDAQLDAYDRERYQTTYAREPGAIAAPTAGMHFTDALLERIRVMGVEIATVTLHVGVGTFAPVRTENLSEHRMHFEEYEVGEDAARSISRALTEKRRIVAVGTTSVRVIEHCLSRGEIEPQSGRTDLFITPGCDFRGVGALVTNFHLPRSTLLMLVSAFAGRDFILQAYREAVKERYRFYSYGDAMLIL